MELTGSPTPVTATPHLQRLGEFEAALQSYHPSSDAQQTLKGIKLAILTGPTSSGRNTIIKKLMETGRYHFVISDTTRPPRHNNGVLERDGIEYWFRTEDDMLADLKAGKFLEAEVIHGQQVSGISMRELEKAYQEHRAAITDTDIGGVHNILRAKPDTTIMLILPPSFEEWQRRIKHRGSMSDAEYRRRLQTACTIFATPENNANFSIIINDDLQTAAKQVDTIAQTGRVDPIIQAKGLQLARQLYEATSNLL